MQYVWLLCILYFFYKLLTIFIYFFNYSYHLCIMRGLNFLIADAFMAVFLVVFLTANTFLDAFYASLPYFFQEVLRF